MPEFTVEELRGIELEPENIVSVETCDYDSRLVYVTHRIKGGLHVTKVLATAVDFIDRAGRDPREFFMMHGKTSTITINARYVDHIDIIPSYGVQIVLTSEADYYSTLWMHAELNDAVAKLETCRQYIKQKDDER